MYLVSIVDVKPGQVLAKAVAGAGGAVLCPAGFRLTEIAIRRLTNAGIESLVVQGDTEDTAGLERRIEALGMRFKGIEDPIMLQIKATVEQRLNWFLLERSGEAKS
jgi:hypothetical protein